MIKKVRWAVRENMIKFRIKHSNIIIKINKCKKEGINSYNIKIMFYI